jgi:GMP synthase (glutamine-hydrolysing)
VLQHPLAQAWLGDAGPRHVFHWHYEAFELPPGAVGLAGSAACTHQAFAIGPHLAMQWHVELDAEKLARWSQDSDGPFLAAIAPHAGTVQSGERMRAEAPERLRDQQALARRIYARWLGLAAVR